MENWCVFCGKHIPDEQLTCDACAVIVKNLPPEQKKAFEKYCSEEENRKKLRDAAAAVKEQIAQMIEPLVNALQKIMVALNDALQREGDE